MAEAYDADHARREYNRAVVAAQKEAAGGPPLEGSFEADGRNTGKQFSFRYPKSSDVSKWGRGVLNKNGLAIALGGAGAFTRGADGAATQRIPYKALHVAGHQEDLTVEIPVTVPAGGTIVRGWGAARTTALKLVIMDFLCCRADEDDEAPHAAPAPEVTAPEPMGLPDAPTSVIFDSTATARGQEALGRLVAACREHGEHRADAIRGANEALAKAGRPALVAENCGLARPVEDADAPALDDYRAELAAALLAGKGGEVEEAPLPNAGAGSHTAARPQVAPPVATAPAPRPTAPSATPFLSAPAAVATPTPPAPPANAPAPVAAPPAAPATPGRESCVADDPALEQRWNLFLSRLRTARKARGQDKPEHKGAVLAALNGAAGVTVLHETRPFDGGLVTTSAVERLERWVASYEAGK